MSWSSVSNVSTPRTPKRNRRRGQAMVEYSVINFVLVMVLCLSATARVFPSPRHRPNDPQKNLIELFLDAYQVYYDSYYFVLNLPFP